MPGASGSDKAGRAEIQAEAEDALEAAISWADVADGSLIDALRFSIGRAPLLGDHFTATSFSELPVSYTQVTGAGSQTLQPDDEPSCLVLQTGGNATDDEEIKSDQTFSLADYPGATKLVLEGRFKISSEADIKVFFGARNLNVNNDVWEFALNTDEVARDTGSITTQVASSQTIQEIDIVGSFDMTTFHTYRLEFTPGDKVELFVDGVSQGSQDTNADVPPDMSWLFQLKVETNAAAQKSLIIDYWKPWGE